MNTENPSNKESAPVIPGALSLHIIYFFRAQRLQLLHKIGYIVRAATGKNARKRNANPCHVEIHTQRGVEVRSNTKA